MVHNMRTPVIRRLVGRVAKLKLNRGGAVPQALNLELLGIEHGTGLRAFGRKPR